MRAHQRAHFPPATHKIQRGKLGRLGVTSVQDVFIHFAPGTPLIFKITLHQRQINPMLLI